MVPLNNKGQAHKQCACTSSKTLTHINQLCVDIKWLIGTDGKRESKGSLLWTHLDDDETVVFWPSTQPKMPFKVMHRKEVTHSNGSYERKSRRWARLIIWDKMKVSLQSDAPEESDLWTAWQLFLLDDDHTCHSKDRVGDRVGVELLYNSVKTEVRQLEIGRIYR